MKTDIGQHQSWTTGRSTQNTCTLVRYALSGLIVLILNASGGLTVCAQSTTNFFRISGPNEMASPAPPTSPSTRSSPRPSPSPSPAPSPSESPSPAPQRSPGSSTTTDTTTVKANDGYLTVRLVTTRIHQQASWYQNYVLADRRLVLSTKVNLVTPTQTISAARTSDPYDMRGLGLFKPKPGSFDIPWGPLLVQDLPATFTNLEISFEVSRTAKNGLNDLIDAASQVSQAVPALSMTPQALAAVGAARAISDFLVARRLVESKFKAFLPVDVSRAEGFPAGFYVAFAGNTEQDYRRYQNSPQSLRWTGSQLEFGGTAVDNVTFIILQVEGVSYRFPATNRVNTALSRPSAWGTVYRRARNLALRVTTSNRDAIQGEINVLLTEAQALLGEDISLTEGERNEIHKAIMGEIGTTLGTTPAVSPSPKPSPSPTP